MEDGEHDAAGSEGARQTGAASVHGGEGELPLEPEAARSLYTPVNAGDRGPDAI